MMADPNLYAYANTINTPEPPQIHAEETKKKDRPYFPDPEADDGAGDRTRWYPFGLPEAAAKAFIMASVKDKLRRGK